jgi:hypothetical protein
VPRLFAGVPASKGGADPTRGSLAMWISEDYPNKCSNDKATRHALANPRARVQRPLPEDCRDAQVVTAERPPDVFDAISRGQSLLYGPSAQPGNYRVTGVRDGPGRSVMLIHSPPEIR